MVIAQIGVLYYDWYRADDISLLGIQDPEYGKGGNCGSVDHYD